MLSAWPDTGHLAEGEFVSSPRCRVTFSSLSTLSSAHCTSSYIPPWGGSSYRYDLEFFCMGDLTILPHFFLYASLYLYQYGHMHVYWLVIQYRGIYFVAQIVLAEALGSSFSWLLFSFLFFFFHSSTFFLAWQGTAGSSCVFPARALESAISPGSPGSFDWRRIL